MKKTVIRILSLVLVLFTLLSCFIACKDDPAVDAGGSDSATDSADITDSDTDEGADTDADGYLKDTLPETYDFKGVDFRILQWEAGHDFIVGAEATTTAVNRVKYQSQKSVEERFKVKIKVKQVPDGWKGDGVTQLVQALEASVVSNSGTYDMVSHYSDTAGVSSFKGYTTNLLSLKYVDFEKPWWSANLLDTAKIGDKMYYCGGDINGENLMRYMYCKYVNLDLYEKYKIGDMVGGRTIFQVVDDGDWTIDTFKMMAIGSMSNEDALYGLVMRDDEYLDAYLYAGGFTIAKSSEGLLTLNEDLESAKIATWFSKCQSIFARDLNVDVKPNDIKPFMDGRSLFAGDEGLDTAEQMSADGSVNFSILPIPKYDSDQERYYTCQGVYSSLITVPSDVKDREMCGMILEGLASSNHRVVKDVVYYDVFQTRFAAAESADGARMFDILYNSIVFDTARAFLHIGMPSFIWRETVRDAEKQWVSSYTAARDSFIKGLNDLYGTLG